MNRYKEDNGPSSFHKLIRDSPKIRHKLQLTPEYLPTRTPPPLNTSSLINEHKPKKYWKHHHPNGILLPTNICKNKNYSEKQRGKCTYVELVDVAMQESTNLLLPHVASSPIHSLHENGNVVHNGSLPNNFPRPV